MTMMKLEVMAVRMVEVASRERKWGKFVRYIPAMLALGYRHVVPSYICHTICCTVT